MKRMFRSRPTATVGLDVGALAPMVDMMTLLLVFLLRTYSADAAPMPPEGPFELATTASDDERHVGTEILVSDVAVYVDGHRIAAWDFIEGEGVIRPLYDRLLATRGKASVEVHADRAVEWRQLSRVLATARAAGFERLSLVGAHAASL